MNLTVQHVDGMRFLVMTAEHAVIIDASPEDGGGGTALTAPQLFAGALGGCILEFVANSCRLRGIPVERLSVKIAYEEMAKPRRVGTVEAAICIEPDPPEDVKRRLLGVARHATLVKTLERPPEVDISFARTQNEADAAVEWLLSP
jgi:uncharacterized OsmC-like protein